MQVGFNGMCGSLIVPYGWWLIKIVANRPKSFGRSFNCNCKFCNYAIAIAIAGHCAMDSCVVGQISRDTIIYVCVHTSKTICCSPCTTGCQHDFNVCVYHTDSVNNFFAFFPDLTERNVLENRF